VPTAAPLPASGSKAIAKPITTPIATPNSTTPAAAVARPIAATVAGATVAGAKPASVTTRPAPVVVAPAPAAAVAKPAKAPAATTGAAATAGPAATTAQSTRPAPAANAPARLRISISQDCWVEVYDATDKRLYVDLAPAGKRIEVTGAAPLRVRLGREGVAQLQVNDRAVTPPTAARRGQTALFTVTAEGATELVKRD
jgi:cytoskeleton protein RodZ